MSEDNEELMRAETLARGRMRAGPVVVKIGSSVLAAKKGGLDPHRVRAIANQVAEVATTKRWPVVVSSGAILAGVGALGLSAKPKTMPGLQAAAAVGQSRLMECWSSSLAKHQLPVAQVLLTHADLGDRRRFLNARRALGEINRRRAIAVINENDTVSTEEIAFGDNDLLAAQVANVVDASVLVLLTVAPGLLDASGSLVARAFADDPRLDGMIRKETSKHGRGGMGSKVAAARACAARDTVCLIVPGLEPNALVDALSGKAVGSMLLPRGEAMRSRAHWMAFTLRPRGCLTVDAGATRAVGRDGRSLLSLGIVHVEGTFEEGDAVDVADPRGQVFARGLVRYSAKDLMQAVESRRKLPEEAIHRDDLVVLSKPD